MSEKDKKNIPEVRFDGFDEEWEKKKLGDDATLFAGGTPSTTNPEYWNGDINWLCSGAVQNNTISEDDVEQKITEKGLQESSAKMIKPDSVLIAMTGATCGNVGYLPFETSGNQSIMAVEPNSDDAKFLYYNLLKNRESILKHKAGGAQAGVNKSSCENIEIMNTSLEEQKKIAEFFKQLDKLIELNEKKVEKLEALKKALLEKMFPVGGATTPKIRFDGFSDEWGKKQLFEVAEFNPKSTLPNIFEYVDLESVVGTTMVSHRTEIKETAPSRAQRVALKGDVFYQTVRPYQKNNYLFDKDETNYVFSTGYAQMRPKVDSLFLMTYIQNDYFVKTVLENCTGTSYPAINSTDLSKISIHIPVSPQEQTLVGVVVTELDNLLVSLNNKIEKFKNLKISLLNKMIPHTHTHTNSSNKI